jgi:hypothetical protein
LAAPAPQTIKTIHYAMYFWLFCLANFGIVQEHTSQGPKLKNNTILISKYRLTHDGNISRTNINQEEDRGTQKIDIKFFLKNKETSTFPSEGKVPHA